MPYFYRPRKLREQKQIKTTKARQVLDRFDELLQDSHAIKNSSYANLVKPLYSVPSSERGVEWTERVVLAYCLKGMKSPRVRSLRRSIIEYWMKQGKPETAEKFRNQVASAIQKSRELNASNYFIDFGSSDKRKIALELTELIKQIELQGFQVYINSGTLLGAARNADFLDHDDDIDLAIILGNMTEKDVSKQFLNVYKTLKASIPNKIKSSFNSPVLKINLNQDVTVDLFPYWTNKGNVYIWPYSYGDLRDSDIFPLKHLLINGVEFPTPRNYDEVLRINYGDKWRYPDPEFKFPWPQARKNFRIVLKKYSRSVHINFLFEKIKGLFR